MVAARDLDEAVVLTEQVAPEHLELLVRNRAARLRNAGAILDGPFAPAPRHCAAWRQRSTRWPSWRDTRRTRRRCGCASSGDPTTPLQRAARAERRWAVSR
jgi:hypothetical protein